MGLDENAATAQKQRFLKLDEGFTVADQDSMGRVVTQIRGRLF